VPVTPEEVEKTRKHFAASRSGDRCEECGWNWTTDSDEARAVIDRAPGRYRGLIAGRWEAARAKPDPDVWSPSGYVWHMVDALGIWAERFKALSEEPGAPVTGFDQDDLAEVRSYERLSPAAGLWALGRRAADLAQALESHDPEMQIDHPDFGPWAIGDVVVWLAHEVHHHAWDIERLLPKAD